MRFLRALLCAASLLPLFPAQQFSAQGAPPNAPTFRVNSTLVFLDVTVLDKNGHPVVHGLTRDDFAITEDKRPQRIFSFEAPETHVMAAGSGDDNPEGKAPTTILVLDLLNSSFSDSDFAYIRYSVKKFLDEQPARLAAPAEMMVVGNEYLEMIQGYTRNRADLFYALDHLPAALPFKSMNRMFFWSRFEQSIDALQQIALQNKGVPGRKNVVWVGHGGPSVNLDAPVLSPRDVDVLKDYVHDTTNMLVDSRISLFVIYPGLKPWGQKDLLISAMDADADIGETDPFAGDINFGLLSNATGGQLFFNRNDVDRLIGRSEQLGSEYYTLTYQPDDPDNHADGKFRRIRVTVRDRNLHVVTKAGYFAPDKNESDHSRQHTMDSLIEAAQAVIPFKALDVQVVNVVRHTDAGTAQFMVQLNVKNLHWLAGNDGQDKANLILAAVSLNGDRGVVASRIVSVTLLPKTLAAAQRQQVETQLPITVPFPRKARSVRVVMETETGGRIGTAEVDRKTIDAAPVLPTPNPQLVSHQRPEQVRPSAP